MKNKIKSFKEVCEIVSAEKKKGKKIVYCHGCFDVLHRGHVEFLNESKKLGDMLIVGIESDKNTRFFKGDNRPINNYDSRAFVLASLAAVDYVTDIMDFEDKNEIGDFYFKYYKKLNPSIVTTVKSKDKFFKNKKADTRKLGIELISVGDLYKESSTSIIEKLGL